MAMYILGVREEFVSIYEVDAPSKEQAEARLLDHLGQTAKERETLYEDEYYDCGVVLRYSAVPTDPRVEPIIEKLEDIPIKRSYEN